MPYRLLGKIYKTITTNELFTALEQSGKHSQSPVTTYGVQYQLDLRLKYATNEMIECNGFCFLYYNINMLTTF